MNKIFLVLMTILMLQPFLSFAEDEHDHDSHQEEAFVEIEEEKSINAGIETAKVEKGFLNQQLTFAGEVAVNGDLLVHIAPRFEGTLKTVEKHIGEDVGKGDLLATVQSNNSLSVYEIKSETHGVVIDKDAAIGEFVTSGKPIYTIANFDTVWVNIAIHTHDLHAVSKDQKVTIQSKTANLSQDGIIEYIRPTLSETTRTALARVVLDNSDNKWLPGMFVNVNLNSLSSEQSLLIPSESAVFVDNEYVVFVESTSPDGEYAFEKRDVEVGRDNGEEVEILSGLKVGEIVASGETFILKAELGKGSAEHSH